MHNPETINARIRSLLYFRRENGKSSSIEALSDEEVNPRIRKLEIGRDTGKDRKYELLSDKRKSDVFKNTKREDRFDENDIVE